MISVGQAHETMLELYTGDLEPSMRQAFFNSSLSKRTPLERNVRYAIALRPWRTSELPSPERLDSALRRAGNGLLTANLLTLYHVARAWDDGLIDLDFGYSLDSQRAWRHRMATMWGVGYKVASWALTIFDPLNCLLIPIDSVHCDRLDIDQRQLRKTDSGYRLYLEMENYIIGECGIEPEYPTSSVAAMLWFNHRNVGATSHAGLSCRIGV